MVASKVTYWHRGLDPHIDFDEIYQIAWLAAYDYRFKEDDKKGFIYGVLIRDVVDELRRTKVYLRYRDDFKPEFTTIEEASDEYVCPVEQIDKEIHFKQVINLLESIPLGYGVIAKYLYGMDYNQVFREKGWSEEKLCREMRHVKSSIRELM